MPSSFFDRAKGMFSRVEREAADKASKPVAKKMTPSFHAVSIQPGRRCCHEARALQGQRFLSREAPVLPLRRISIGALTKDVKAVDFSMRFEDL